MAKSDLYQSSKDTNQVCRQVNAEEKGATMVEYALMTALIALVSITAVTTLGRNSSTKFSQVGSRINN